MFEHFKKIFSLLILTGSVMLLTSKLSVAQQMDAQSAADFAESHGGEKYVEVLKAAPGTKVICGNAETVCNKETQVCLKCSVTTSGNGVINKTEYGKCVAKSGFNPHNIRASWPEDGNCLASSRFYPGGGYGGGFSIYPGVLSLESNGFLSANTTDALFYHSIQGHEFTDANGKKYKLFMSKTPTIQYGGDASGDNDSFNGCEVLPVKIYNHQGCFFCPLSGLIFGAANDVTSSAFSAFAGSFKTVVIMVFALWLALLTLGQVFSMTKQDAPKYLTTILKQGFKVMVVYFLLTYSNDLFRIFIIPLLDSGLEFGIGIRAVEMPEPKNYTLTEISTPNAYFNLKGSISGKTLYERIEEFLAIVQAQLAYMQAIGTTLFCVGSHQIITLSFDKFKVGVRMMLLGGVLTSFAFLLTMAFGFYFLDALLQLAVIGAMTPFMIASWPFKATAQYASTGFKMLLNTFFVMFFTGFVISANIELINQSLALSQTMSTTNAEVQNDIPATGEEGQAKSKGFQAIADAINDQNYESLKEATNIGTTGFMLLAFACLFGFKFVAQTTPLASKLSAGGFSKGGIAGRIGTMAASNIKGLASKATAPIRQGIGAATGGVVGIVAGTAGSIVSGAGSIAGLAGRAAGKAGDRLAAKGGAAGWAGKALKAGGKLTEGAGKITSYVGGIGSKVQQSAKRSAAKGK